MTRLLIPRRPTLFVIPKGTPSARCRGCSTLVFFVGKQCLRCAPTCTSRATGNVYETPDALPPTTGSDGKGFDRHIDCPEADRFKSKRR